MITQVLLDLFVGFASLVLGLVPHWTPPGWVTDNTATNAAGTLGGYAGQLGFWVPWSTIAQVAGAVVGLFLVVAGARLALWVYARLPFIGGG